MNEAAPVAVETRQRTNKLPVFNMETMRMKNTCRKRRMPFAALSMVALTALIQSEPGNCKQASLPSSSYNHRPVSQRVLSTQNHGDLLHYFDAVWKDVAATTASTETVVPKCIMPNGDVIGIIVATSSTLDGSRSNNGKSRRRLHSSFGTLSVASKKKKSKKGSKSKFSSTNNVNPSAIINGDLANAGRVIVEQSLPLCNIVDDLPDDNTNHRPDDNTNQLPDDNANHLPDDNANHLPDDNTNQTLSNNNTTPENNNTTFGSNNATQQGNNQTTIQTSEADRCRQITENIDDNTDSNTTQLTMSYTVFSDSDLSDADLSNLQNFFQRVVGPMAAGCPMNSTKTNDQRTRRYRRRFLQENESEIRRLSFDTPSVVTTERGDGCGSVTVHASSTCTVLAQDVTMDYVGDVPNIRGLLMVAMIDSMDPASVLSLGLTGVSDISVLALPPAAAPTPAPVAAPTPAPLARPTTPPAGAAPAPAPPTNVPPLVDVTTGNNDTAADDEGGGDNTGPTISSVNRGNDEPEKKKLLSPGAIAGILFACIFALLAILLLMRRRRRPRNIACRKQLRDDGGGHYTSEDEELSAFMNDNTRGVAYDYEYGGGDSRRNLARVVSETSSHSGGSGRVQHIYSFPVDSDGFPRKSPSVIQVTESQDEVEVSSREQRSSRELEEAVKFAPSVRLLSQDEIPYRPQPRFMERNYLSTDTVQL